ncbi:MAG: carboxypeptidase regulatory-like domain-containing protein, partial [Gemmatimonadaceae bacterium]
LRVWCDRTLDEVIAVRAREVLATPLIAARRLLRVAPLLMAPLLANAQATSTLIGTVLDDSTDGMLPNVEVSIPGLNLTARTNVKGEFILTGIGAGAYNVTARRIGYSPVSVSIPFNGADTVRYQFALVRTVQTLPGVAVTETDDVPRFAKLAQFESRRKFGIGRFLTAKDLEKNINRRTGDALSARLPGARIMKDPRRPLAGYVATSRGVNSVEGASPAFSGRAPPPSSCLVNVWLDGTKVYGGLPGEPPFDINSVQAEQIAAVEFYAGSAALPSELRSGSSACGAIVIWMK